MLWRAALAVGATAEATLIPLFSFGSPGSGSVALIGAAFRVMFRRFAPILRVCVLAF